LFIDLLGLFRHERPLAVSKDSTMQPITHLRVLVFKEGESWVAQALEHDICVQADDEETLRKRFEIVVELESQRSSERGDDRPLGGLTPAPDSFQQMWVQLERERPIDRFPIDGIHVEMATAA
jgi:hypothetical protein